MGKSDTIKIFLRIRPDADQGRLNSGRSGYEVANTFDNSTVQFHIDKRQEDDYINHAVEDYKYKFSRVFEPRSTQEEVFNTVAKDCVLSALDGYNSTLFAYGQTGSGKTFSITGGTESYNDRGIIPRALSLVYEEVAKRTEYDWTVRISYLQLYQETGQDLLNRGSDADKLEDLPKVALHETDDEVVLKGLNAHTVSTVHEALNLLFLGDSNRLYCETPLNKTSSRSHCVFTISLEAREIGTAVVRRSKLNLVDLAGSERVAKSGVSGKILNEAKFINTSLHYLEAVITALAEQSRGNRDHIPYRNSILTRVLRDSLGGNCRTVMLAAGHPADRYLMETVSTCRFAQRVASIKQSAEVNEETDPALLVKQLRAENARLKERIAFLEKGSNSAGGDRELNADELARCRESVSRFFNSSDSNSTIDGVMGDYARITACFNICKEMFNKGGGGGALGGSLRRSSMTPPGSAQGGDASSAQVAGLERKVRELQTALQQKENEMSIMLAVIEKKDRDGAGSGVLPPLMRGQGSSTPPTSGSSVMAAGPNDRPSGWQPATSSTAGGAGAALGGVDVNAASRAQQIVAREQVSQQYQELKQDYNIDALSDPELLKDREHAYQAFRKSYRKLETIEKSKEGLGRMINEVKGIAGHMQQNQEEMRRLKTTVQQIRQQRVLHAGSDETADEPDAEEIQCMTRIKALKQNNGERSVDVNKLKERIEMTQHQITKAGDQMVKDFDNWFTLRQKQINLAKGSGGPSTGASQSLPPPQPAPPQQQQPSMVNQSLFGSGGAASSANRQQSQFQQQPGTPPDLGLGPRTGSGAAFQHQQHMLNRQEQQNISAQYSHLGMRTGPGGPSLVPQQPSAPPGVAAASVTGNPDADAALEQLKAAREKMMAQRNGV